MRTSWPRSCAGDVTSGINWYWWTCLATTHQLVLTPGDVQPPHPRLIRPTLLQSNTGGQEANESGLVPAPLWLLWHSGGSVGCLGVQRWCCVLHLNSVYLLSKPRLATLISSCGLTRANTFWFRRCFSYFIKLMALDRSRSSSIIHRLTVPLETRAGDNHILLILLIINY